MKVNGCLSVHHTDLCSSVDLPEVEIVSLLTEELPKYTLRADHVYGYEHDDWLHTPLLPPEAALGLTHEQIDETLKYFCESTPFFHNIATASAGSRLLELSMRS